MENTCIKVLDMEHGKKVVAYYKSLGVDDVEYAVDFKVGEYIGTFGDCPLLQRCSPNESRWESKVIELPTTPILTFPRVMKVWDGCPEMFCIRTVLNDLGEGIINRYIALEIEQFGYVKKRVQFWMNAEEIEVSPTIIELTLEDIAKKFEIKPDQIKIIK